MANPLLGIVQNMASGGAKTGPAGGNPMFNIVMQLVGGGKIDPQSMVNQLMQSNPQAKQAWEQAQQMSQGKSQEDLQKMIQEMAGQSGLNKEQMDQIVNKFSGK